MFFYTQKYLIEHEIDDNYMGNLNNRVNLNQKLKYESNLPEASIRIRKTMIYII